MFAEFNHWIEPQVVVGFAGVVGSLAAALAPRDGDPGERFAQWSGDKLVTDYESVVSTLRAQGRQVNFAFVATVYLLATAIALVESAISASGSLAGIRSWLWALDKAAFVFVATGTLAFMHAAGLSLVRGSQGLKSAAGLRVRAFILKTVVEVKAGGRHAEDRGNEE